MGEEEDRVGANSGKNGAAAPEQTAMSRRLVLIALGLAGSLMFVGTGSEAHALQDRAGDAVWQSDGPAEVETEEAAVAGEDQLENPDLEQDADATLPGDAKPGEDQVANSETGGEGDAFDSGELPINFFAASTVDADEFTAADFALAEDARAAGHALQDLVETPMTASRDPSTERMLMKRINLAAFESNKSSLITDALGTAVAELGAAFDRLRNQTEIFVTEIDEAGLDVDGRSEEDAQSVENAAGRIDRASLDMGNAVVALSSAVASAFRENAARRDAYDGAVRHCSKPTAQACSTLLKRLRHRAQA